jgi:hypothetical protein
LISATKNIQVVIVEFEATDSLVQLESLQWPQVDGDDEICGPSFYVSKNHEETSPNHPDYAFSIGLMKLELSSGQRDNYFRKAEMQLRNIYPKTSSKIVHRHIVEHSLGGHSIANNITKYHAKLSARTEVDNFYLTGCDLAYDGFMGEIQSGWVTANAVLGELFRISWHPRVDLILFIRSCRILDE